MVKTVLNKSHNPVRVPLPRGKILHLGPHKSGQISHKDLEHEPLRRLIDTGIIEIQGDEMAEDAAHEHGQGPHADTHGHHQRPGSPVRGDR